MKRLNKSIVAILHFLLTTSIAAYAQTSLVGKWRGTENNLPIIDLTIDTNTGQAIG